MLILPAAVLPSTQGTSDSAEEFAEKREHEPYFSDMYRSLYAAREAGDTKSVRAFLEQMEAEETADSFFTLGEFYAGGDFVQKDEARAFKYFQSAERLGSESAKTRLLFMTLEGRGTKKDVDAGLNTVRAWAKDGDPWAMALLGDFYLFGSYLPEDCDKAISWYLKAAEFDFPNVWEKLARFYHHGTCVEKNPERSAFWASKAAEAGQPWAMEKWASALMYGDGVPQDKVAGYMWLVLAWDFYAGPVPDVYDNLTTPEERSLGRTRAEAWRADHREYRVEYPK